MLSQEEISRLQSFRRAARRAHTILDKYWGIRFYLPVGEPKADDPPTSLRDEAFFALLTAVRLVYLQKEAANFVRTAKTLRKTLPSEFASALDVIVANWREARTGGPAFKGPRIELSAEQSLDALMNGIVFHQDPKHHDGARLIENTSPLSDIALQQAVFLLGHAMIQLDSLVAYALREATLPRAPTVQPPDAAS